jgi:hypothetical protein
VPRGRGWKAALGSTLGILAAARQQIRHACAIMGKQRLRYTYFQGLGMKLAFFSLLVQRKSIPA